MPEVVGLSTRAVQPSGISPAVDSTPPVAGPDELTFRLLSALAWRALDCTTPPPVAISPPSQTAVFSRFMLDGTLGMLAVRTTVEFGPVGPVGPVVPAPVGPVGPV